MRVPQTAPTPDRHGNKILALAGLVAFWFLDSYAFQYLTLDRDRFGIYWARREWIYVHVVAGMLALLLGPVQFWLALNRREKILHRIFGTFYVLSVFAGSGAALYLARHTDFGWVFGMGLTAMAVGWILSTALATIAIGLHLAEQHREWMTRSYVFTFGFVTFRMLTEAFQIIGVGTTLDQMTAASWFCWSVPLMLTECLVQGRKIFATLRRCCSRTEEVPVQTTQIDLFDQQPSVDTVAALYERRQSSG